MPTVKRIDKAELARWAREGLIEPGADRTPPKARPSKYRAKAVYRTPDGRYVGADYPGEKIKEFDSRREYARWLALNLMLRAGRISDLRRQVVYELKANGVTIAKYVADFVYVEDGQTVVEDVKGVRTAMYRLKKKWVKAEYGIVIRET